MNIIAWILLLLFLILCYSIIPFSEKALVAVKGLYEEWRISGLQKEPGWYAYWVRRNAEIWLTLKSARLFILMILFYFLVSVQKGSEAVVVSLIFTFVMVGFFVVIELLGRGIQERIARRFLPFAVRYLYVLSYLLEPVHFVVRKLARPLFMRLRWGAFQVNPWLEDQTVERLKRIDMVARGKSVERALIYKIFELGEKWVRDVMVPKSKIVILPNKMTVRQILTEAQSKGHSRFPVLKENTDEILGVLYIRDVFKILDENSLDEQFDVSRWVRSPYFVPETKRVRELMLEFQYKKRHFALVVDEYGALVGMVTRDDLYQDLLGEFPGVAGGQDDLVQYVEPDILIVKAELPLDDLEDQLDLVFPEKRDYTTLAGFLLSRFGNVPQVGDEISFGGWNFQVIDASEKTIRQVRISRSA